MSKKRTDTVAGLNKPYEENEIQLKGILSFTIGLAFLIVLTFGLMWAFLGVMDDFLNVPATNPLAMSDKDRLPAEPRLQGAPGFGVDSEKGRVNLELREPQAEYRELKKQWDELWKSGQKDERTGVKSMLPIDEAKDRFLKQNVKAKSGADAESVVAGSRDFFSDSSSGRIASETRR